MGACPAGDRAAWVLDLPFQTSHSNEISDGGGHSDCARGEPCSRDCPQPKVPAPTGCSEIDLGPRERAGRQPAPWEMRRVLSVAAGSPDTPHSFPRSAPTGWAQRPAGPACRHCPRRPTGRRRRCATRPPPPTSSRPTSRRPTLSRRCPTARRPTPPPPFPTWQGTRTAAWHPWRSRSLRRPPGPRPAPPPAPTTSRPACWRRQPAPWASTRAVTTPLLLCRGSCKA